MQNSRNKISTFLESQNIKYKDITLYVRAFSHMSYINETTEKHNHSYEKLEFLGDAILGKIVTEYIYKNFTELSPGELSLLRSSVVSKKFLSQVGKDLNLEKYALISDGTAKQSTILSDSIYEDIVESIVGAIYLDVGELEAKLFVFKNICSKINDINFSDMKDYKTKLQELLQSEKRKSVEYVLLKQIRQGNKVVFTSEVIFEGQALGKGVGNSRKESEQAAAKQAFERVSK